AAPTGCAPCRLQRCCREQGRGRRRARPRLREPTGSRRPAPPARRGGDRRRPLVDRRGDAPRGIEGGERGEPPLPARPRRAVGTGRAPPTERSVSGAPRSRRVDRLARRGGGPPDEGGERGTGGA